MGGGAGDAGRGDDRGGGRTVPQGRLDLSDPEAAGEVAALVAEVRARVAGGQKQTRAVAEVAAGAGVAKRALDDAPPGPDARLGCCRSSVLQRWPR